MAADPCLRLCRHQDQYIHTCSKRKKTWYTNHNIHFYFNTDWIYCIFRTFLKICTPHLYKICLYTAYNNWALQTKIVNTILYIYRKILLYDLTWKLAKYLTRVQHGMQFLVILCNSSGQEQLWWIWWVLKSILQFQWLNDYFKILFFDFSIILTDLNTFNHCIFCDLKSIPFDTLGCPVKILNM